MPRMISDFDLIAIFHQPFIPKTRPKALSRLVFPLKTLV